jgi:hypothetical protein
MGYDPKQPRDPKGTETGGQWAAAGKAARKAAGLREENKAVGFAAPRGETVFAITDASKLDNQIGIVVKLDNSEVFASHDSVSHMSILHAVYPPEKEPSWHTVATIDNYVRFYYDKGAIKISTDYAGLVVADRKTNTSAINNIYKALDHLVHLGLPANTPVEIKSSFRPYLIKTTAGK